MAKVTIEFDNATQKQINAVIATMSKTPAKAEETADESEEDANEEEAPAPPKTKAKGKAKPEPVEEEDDLLGDSEEAEEDEPLYTQARVVEKCTELINAGKSAKVKEALAKIGCTRIKEVKPAQFDKFMGLLNKIK